MLVFQCISSHLLCWRWAAHLGLSHNVPAPIQTAELPPNQLLDYCKQRGTFTSAGDPLPTAPQPRDCSGSGSAPLQCQRVRRQPGPPHPLLHQALLSRPPAPMPLRSPRPLGRELDAEPVTSRDTAPSGIWEFGWWVFQNLNKVLEILSVI